MDLHEPLGTKPPVKSYGRALAIGAACAVGLTAVTAAAVTLVRADPRAAEPFAVAALPPPLAKAAPPAVPTSPAAPTATVAAASVQPDAAAPLSPASATLATAARDPRFDAGTIEAGVKVFRGTPAAAAAAPASADRPLIIDVTKVLDDPLAKHKGAKPPATAVVPVGGPAKPAAAAPPQVAIFVSGMGLSRDATRTATEMMPAGVTFAFVPYGDKLGPLVEAAKARGHEVLLQLPMRSAGGMSPGPHALVADATPDATKADLAWLMDRFKGYSGVTNLLGAPVTADAAAMTAVLRATGARDLFFLDDGTSKRSRATALAADLNVPAAKADVVLDATADPAVVRANLDALVAIAKRKGSAIGMASGLPEHLGTIARFAAGLGAKGVTLVPVSRLVRRETTVAASP